MSDSAPRSPHATAPRSPDTDPLSGMLQTLDLISTGTGAVSGEDTFIGQSQWTPIGRVFGGQVLAQSLVAAMRTTADDRIVHSLHCYFLRPGDIRQPIEFSVDRIHDGRSFSTRRTQAYQNGKPILSMIASFQREDEGLDHQIDMPSDLPDPESLPTVGQWLDGVDNPSARSWATDRAFDMRHVSAPVFLRVDGPEVAHQAVWIKTIGQIPDDPNLHRAALAYASDYTLLEPILRRHGVPWSTAGLKIASLDHAMWWHRFGRVDEWMLYIQESPTATGGRGLSLGRIYDRSGRLLASVAQEGMVRVP